MTTPKRGSGNQPAVADPAADVTPAATTSTGGGVSFSFVHGTTTYDVKIASPDPNNQYGFLVSQGSTVIASLTYKDEHNWQIMVGLPSALKIDDNLTINSLNVNIENGVVVPLG